jgi:replication factor C subunit 1
MDIRNFFGGGGPKASKAKVNAKSPSPKPSRKRSSNVMKEKETKEETPKEEAKESKPKTEETDLRKSSPVKKSKRDSAGTTPNQSKKIKRKRPPVEESDHESDDNDDDFQPKVKSKQTPKKSPKKRKAPSKTPPPLLSKPSQPVASYPQEEATPNILANLTFCITGQLTSLSREDATEYIKILGGRVTAGVSGKTSYLLAGETLEDGREAHEGKKYKKAQDLNTIILNGEEEMYGLVKTLDDNLKGSLNGTTVADTEAKSKGGVPHVVKNPYASNFTPKNPYASSSSTTPPKNPYTNSAAPKNPYAKNPYSSKPSAAASTPTPKETVSGGGRAKVTDPNALWADKYAPNSSRGMLGNAVNVRKLSSCKYTFLVCNDVCHLLCLILVSSQRAQIMGKYLSQWIHKISSTKGTLQGSTVIRSTRNWKDHHGSLGSKGMWTTGIGIECIGCSIEKKSRDHGLGSRRRIASSNLFGQKDGFVQTMYHYG